MSLIRRSILTLAVAAIAAATTQCAAASSQQSQAGDLKRAAETILAADILRDVSVIASDANMGRATPSAGYDSAAAYIARSLAQLGIRPMGDNGTYFQYYDVTRSVLDTVSTRGTIGGDAIAWGEDFIVNTFLVPGVREADVVYVGHGIRATKLGIDAYDGVDIKGKWVLVHTAGAGQPAFPAGHTSATIGRIGVDYTTIREESRLQGALGVLMVPNTVLLTGWNRRATVGRDLNPAVGWAYAPAYLVPRVVLSVTAMERLLQGSGMDVSQLRIADSTREFPASRELGATRRVAIEFAATTTNDRPYNVVGMLEGTDARLRDEWVSLAAHLDGAVGRGSRDGDSIYNAADDNGSGSAGNMAIARALVAGPRPRRSILLIWDSGEEVGLWGTRHLAYGPMSEKIVAHVSNDMIGRSKAPGSNNPGEGNLARPGEVYITGPKLLSTGLEAILQRSLAEFPYATANRMYEDERSEFFYPRTDAAPYLERGIPIVQFFTGLHADYHGVGDEVSKLDPRQMEAISRQSYVTLWMIANEVTRVRWDLPAPSTLWFVRTAGR
jgi:hypothetical protein